MQLLVAAVGQRMPGWVNQAWLEYARRMPPELKLTLRELPMARRGKNADIARMKSCEGKLLEQAMPKGGRVVALDIGGSAWSTEQLAANLERWMSDGRDVGFMIGGPDGIPASAVRRAHDRWSLGPLTLPHPLARVVLAEQLYRAWTITRNHPYHRA